MSELTNFDLTSDWLTDIFVVKLKETGAGIQEVDHNIFCVFQR